ncbi:hypothetical protein [Massilia eburnea]|uniref:hypothetical protein n=1 Tax=Massilia eburnea TaxID=1776165 RepID=UPI003D6A9EBE
MSKLFPRHQHLAPESGRTGPTAPGRIVNVGNGATTLDADHGITTNGTIAGNGALQISAATLENQANGTIASAQGMTATVTGSLANAGTINSGGKLASQRQRRYGQQ